MSNYKENYRKKVIIVSRCSWTLYNFRMGLMSALLREGWEVLAAGARDGIHEVKIEESGVRFIGLNIDKKGVNPWQDIKLIKQLYNVYKSEKPAVVHHFTIKPVIYGGIAAKLSNMPRVISTITGLGYVFTGRA